MTANATPCFKYCPYHERRVLGWPYYAPVIALMGANWLLRSWSLFNTDIAGGSSAVLFSEGWPYVYAVAGVMLLVIAYCLKRRPKLQMVAMVIGAGVYGFRALTIIWGDFAFLDVAHIWSDDMMTAILIGASWPTLLGRKKVDIE